MVLGSVQKRKQLTKRRLSDILPPSRHRWVFIHPHRVARNECNMKRFRFALDTVDEAFCLATDLIEALDYEQVNGNCAFVKRLAVGSDHDGPRLGVRLESQSPRRHGWCPDLTRRPPNDFTSLCQIQLWT